MRHSKEGVGEKFNVLKDVPEGYEEIVWRKNIDSPAAGANVTLRKATKAEEARDRR